ncbi:Hint domain-containing protein [Phaeovulum sp.]|uniref:Hint domain-containing protein n=1 Tax=Phaeovulum sp. TaxID=2934796 RepID=UPI0039E3A7DB
MPTNAPALPPVTVTHVFAADAVRVTSGANQGDGLNLAGLCERGDIYQLDRAAQSMTLMLHSAPPTDTVREQTVAPGSQIGQAGDPVTLVGRHVMMAADGDIVDILMIQHGKTHDLYALPMTPMAPRTEYTLIEVHEDPGTVRLSDLICIAFTTGTMITLAGGMQRPIEMLIPGDMVLTRDSGPQPVRLVAKATLRALGSFAPVVISAGTLGNEGDLVVSPHHRIFLYRRGAQRIGQTAEILVQAKYLVDGSHVWRREGGYINYYALVFDRHEIVYAEGIPCESLLVSDTTLSLLPDELAAEVRAHLPGLTHQPHLGTEAGPELIDSATRDKLFRKTD